MYDCFGRLDAWHSMWGFTGRFTCYVMPSGKKSVPQSLLWLWVVVANTPRIKVQKHPIKWGSSLGTQQQMHCTKVITMASVISSTSIPLHLCHSDCTTAQKLRLILSLALFFVGFIATCLTRKRAPVVPFTLVIAITNKLALPCSNRPWSGMGTHSHMP